MEFGGEGEEVEGVGELAEAVGVVIAAVVGIAVAGGDGVDDQFARVFEEVVGSRGVLEDAAQLAAKTAIFSAPMWGISASPRMRVLAWIVSHTFEVVGLGQTLTPATVKEPYLLTHGFEGNDLTTDSEMYDYMRRQVEAHDDLTLCGPSARWLAEALRECRDLMRSPGPKIPTLIGLGTDEAIVDPLAVRRYAFAWAEAELAEFGGGQHELLMERAEIRDAFLAKTLKLFDSHAIAP